jgi:hypothetical protein
LFVDKDGGGNRKEKQIILDNVREEGKKKKAKLSLYQDVQAYAVVRRRGSTICR